jgi:hypothetical protein
MSVARAQREIDSAEFVEWMARDQLPGMHSETQRMAGLLASVLANVNRDPKRRPQPFQPADFFTPEPPVVVGPRTNEELMAMATAWAAAMNARVKA